MDLATCSEVQYEVKDGIHGVSYNYCDGESGWTPVVGRKKRRRVPDYIKRIFSPDHPIPNTNLSEFDSDSTSDDQDLNTVIPTGANVEVHFKMIDNTPGQAISTRSTRSWTPVAARTRAKLTI